LAQVAAAEMQSFIVWMMAWMQGRRLHADNGRILQNAVVYLLMKILMKKAM
jgi:hypothetical protein